MGIKWKYVEPFDVKLFPQIEGHFGISLPEDYKNSLQHCNGGKPTLVRFNTEGRKKCVLDYLINLQNTVATAKAIPRDNLIPIGTDPFGNLIAFQINAGQVDSVVFWDNERDTVFKISNSFSELIENLY